MSLEKNELSISQAPSDDNITNLKDLDTDALKLAEMGYTQDMKRNFSVLSVLGVGFSLTNSWFAISAALITGINSGGPVLIIYGILLIALISTCVGISLSELASAMPNAGGQYFWANELAPKKYANFASYLTGWFAWAGSVFTSASVALAVGSAGVGCWQLAHPDLYDFLLSSSLSANCSSVIHAWHVFVAYQVINTFAFVFNCYGKLLPAIANTALYCSLISFFVILVVVPAKAPTHQDARFVFANFVNNTGWTQNGIAFIVGLINTNWAFACLDCATHMAEEVQRPEKMIPIAIMGTVAIGLVTSWFYSISMFFSVNNLDALFDTPTEVPILELFDQALSSKAGAIALESLIMATGIGCQIASHTWQSRLCWSFARDRGLPFAPYLSKIHPTLDVPLHAHFVSCVIVAILGCLYLGSYTAFNR
ncbi:hypothetical protein MMC12_005938 [Toensbergia leucococca]|nr:hypothetical protein [Toensbergia leucococca]